MHLAEEVDEVGLVNLVHLVEEVHLVQEVNLVHLVGEVGLVINTDDNDKGQLREAPLRLASPLFGHCP